ncbi:MAG TPA: hypothetical protein ENJ19_00445 [Gammaproteobacteria bacterium]|nr:hypothetical protein [Gammaproteobacteria bacterium]
MAQTIQWTSTVVVGGNTAMSLSRAISVEAVDIIKITVRGSGTTGGPDTDKEVEVQPGGAGQVKFLAISADRFGDDLNFLSYKVNSSANPSFQLDQPITLAGTGAVSALDNAPGSLFFSSTLVQDATIHIVVGRDATP